MVGCNGSNHDCVRATTHVFRAANLYVLSGKGQEPSILRGCRGLAINWEKDRSVVAKDNKWRTILCASRCASRTDWLVQSLGVSAGGVDHPATDRSALALDPALTKAQDWDGNCRRKPQHRYSFHDASPCFVIAARGSYTFPGPGWFGGAKGSWYTEWVVAAHCPWIPPSTPAQENATKVFTEAR